MSKRRLCEREVRSFYEEHGCTLLAKKYIRNSKKMKFKCACGGLGEKAFADFKKAPHCRECTRKVISRAKRHSYEDVYNFVVNNSDATLLSKSYKNNSTDMRFECKCGSKFTTTYARFKDRGKRQCNQCSILNQRSRFAFDFEFVKDFIESYDCTLLSDRYINNSTPLDIKCKCGEVFQATFKRFRCEERKIRKCPKCMSIDRSSNARFSIKEVKEIAKSFDCELVSEEYLGAKEPLVFLCECGNEFTTSLDIFQRHKHRCDVCTTSISSLERVVQLYLEDNNIEYISEYRVDDCRHIHPLPFDFAVMKDNCLQFLIEVDGQQHFEPVDFFGGEDVFEQQKFRDSLKNDFCEENSIKLVRIPYYDIDKVDEILQTHI